MPVYRLGSKGDEVRKIQERLKALGYYQGRVDGDFGTRTEAAVKAFQKAKKLTVDGVVGSKTSKALSAEEIAEPSAVPTPPPTLKIDRSLRLEAKDYIVSETRKNLIVLHHTVGGSVRSTVDYWRTEPEQKRVATAYLVERNGVVYEVFDPKHWAFHLGLKGAKGEVDRRSIGIEIASEGGLIQRDGKLYCFDKASDRTLFTQDYYDHGMPWRGYRFYDAYSEAQISAVIALINFLCKQFEIPRKTPANHFDADDAYREYAGVLGHHHLRPDKSDVHPGFAWQRVVEGCKLELV